jgi:hypothetical protein
MRRGGERVSAVYDQFKRKLAGPCVRAFGPPEVKTQEHGRRAGPLVGHNQEKVDRGSSRRAEGDSDLLPGGLARQELGIGPFHDALNVRRRRGGCVVESVEN